MPNGSVLNSEAAEGPPVLPAPPPLTGEQIQNIPVGGERQAAIIQAWRDYARVNDLSRDTAISRKNPGRDIYRLPNGNYLSVDRLHGNAEVHNSRGQHLGATGPNGGIIQGSQDTSRGHDIRI